MEDSLVVESHLESLEIAISKQGHMKETNTHVGEILVVQTQQHLAVTTQVLSKH